MKTLGKQEVVKSGTDLLVPLHTATADPTVNDDIDQGYDVGYLWKRTDTDEMFECTDNTNGAAVWKPYNRLEVNEQTGTSYTLKLSDMGKMVECTNASAITLTVPPNSSVAFSTGCVIGVHQGGAGAITITAGSGVTINSAGSLVDTNGQYAEVFLRKVAINTWVLTGNRA